MPQDRLEAEAFEGLRLLVLQAGGIDLSLYKDNCVLRRITLRQRSCGAPDLQAYLRLISHDLAERSRLVKALTIHVSQFFRNPSTFHAIGEFVLPRILATKGTEGGRGLRLWSAGCAGGEEAYSLAILVQEAGLGAARERSATIYATDIDPDSLRRAKEARYDAPSLTNVPHRWRRRYFIRDGGGCRAGAELRRLLVFRRHNILDPPPFGRMDLVVCRNLLIYMTEAMQERVLLSLCEALNPGGFLILGKVEGLTEAARNLLEPVNIAERIYRKHEPRPPRRD